MKLKALVVDGRWLVRAAVLGGVLLVGAVAYAGVPKTWVSGDTLNATDLNANFAALDARITTLESAEPRIVAITAVLSGTAAENGGTQGTNCPAGYKLIAAALADDQRVQAGTNGWNNGGTVSCAVGTNGTTLTAGLNDYQSGNTQTSITCYGICTR